MTKQQVLQKLTALCSGSEHCSHEMEEKMKKWDVDEKTQAEVMEFLIKEKYVDDERFCRCFVREKIRFNKWGRRKVEQALYMKRIPESISREVLDDVPDEEYLKVLRPFIKSKERTTTARSEYERNLKIIKSAMSRGFSFNLIKEVMSADVDDIDIDDSED